MSRIVRAVGAILIVIGVVCREIYHSKSLWIRMQEAFVEGSNYGADGAPMNWYHREWALPSNVSALGIIAVALMVLGLALVFFPKRKPSR